LRQAREIARAVSRLERGEAELPVVLGDLGLAPADGYVVGVTGPPGSGKSTLVDKLTRALRAEQRTVAIVAVDPSSPFSGGALLGDRVRMMAHSGDEGVFIRSMAARRALGGLAPTTHDVARLLTAVGFDLVIVETVGVGQSELDVVKTADTVLVVTVPGLGDSIQTLKAGLLEVADLFVVNMADRAGVDRTVAELRAMQTLGPKRSAWTPPIVETVASENRGIDTLWAAISRHRAFLERSGEREKRRRQRLAAETRELIERRLRARLEQRLQNEAELASILRQATDGELDPHTAAAQITAAFEGCARRPSA
jgi:LAO/AO transport system kinase